MYTGHAFFVRPKFRQDRQLDRQAGGKHRHWFWGTLFSSWRIYRDVLLASLMINLFGLTGPFFTMNVYDRVIPNLAFETLWVLGLGIGTVKCLLGLVAGGLERVLGLVGHVVDHVLGVLGGVVHHLQIP